jgi:GMP synthase-like glutamine amidotransferase
MSSHTRLAASAPLRGNSRGSSQQYSRRHLRRIGVLLTNTDESAFAKRFPNDGLKVKAWLAPLAPHWGFEVVAVKDGVLPASVRDFDGYVITGSIASVNDTSLPWVAPLLRFIEQLNQAQVPTVGLCFGHQAIAKALGGSVDLNPNGWSLGLAKMRSPQGSAWLPAAHSEQVVTLPRGAQVLASGPQCPYALMRIGDTFLSTQYHPEMPVYFLSALLDKLARKLPAESRAAQANLATLGAAPIQTSAHWFGQWAVHWLSGERAA